MTNLKGTQIDDVMLMNNAVEEFKERFTNKFMQASSSTTQMEIKEWCMPIDQKIKEAKNEVLDLWAYLHAMEYYYGGKETKGAALKRWFKEKWKDQDGDPCGKKKGRLKMSTHQENF